MIKVGVHMVHKAHSPFLWLMTSLNVGYVRHIRNYRFVYSYSGSIEINRGILVVSGSGDWSIKGSKLALAAFHFSGFALNSQYRYTL